MTRLEFARDRSVSPRFAYVGRLVSEKGFEAVIEVARGFLENPDRSSLVEIYGTGPLRNEMLRQLLRYPGFFDASENGKIPPGAQVVYFGHVNGTRVKEALSRAHYLLMPSRFLETFGLSALEAIESGVPVIGFDQGGLSQFLLSEHRVPVNAYPIRQFVETVSQIEARFSGADWRRQSLSVQDIAAKFSRETWLAEVRKHMGPNIRKILLISDYSAPIGGIETHIQGSVEVLRGAGYEVDALFGMSGTSRYLRYVGLLLSWGNFSYAIRLWWRLRTYRPDLVWIHSEVRCIGPIGLLSLRQYGGEVWKTYHDLGHFGAFPTEFTHESQLSKPSDFRSFFARSRGRHRYFLLHILAKFYQIRAIRAIIGFRGFHIIPSEFMLPAVNRFIGGAAKAGTISHFSPHHQ